MKAKRWLSVLSAFVLIFLLAVPATAAGPTDYITNGSFEAGNTGFTSDYTYVDVLSQSGGQYGLGTMDPEQSYAIGTNPFLGHQYWASYTAQDGSNMMIVNATPSQPEKTVWQQTVTLPDYNPVSTFELIAGQNWEAGEVQVKIENGTIRVRMILTDQRGDPDNGWRITAMHVQVASNCTAIPNKNGNPIPGQFNFKLSFSPGTLDTGWQDTGYSATLSNELCIAAHADIKHAEVGHMQPYEFCVTSGTTTALVSGGSAAISPALQSNPAWTWPGFENAFDCAPSWIWDAAKMNDVAAGTGSRVDLEDTFDIIGSPISATLRIAADNAFAWSVNGGNPTARNLEPGWETATSWLPTAVITNPMQSDGVFYPGWGGKTYSGPGWGELYTFPVSGLTTGLNTLNVTAINATWDVPQWDLVNPGGVIYELCGTSQKYIIDQQYQSETGWGDGDPFPGANWATCMHYTPSVAPTYTFSVWAANSHPDNPAVLDIVFDGNVVGNMHLDTISPLLSTWQQFTYSFQSNGGSLIIKIVDTYTIKQGDDFAIDNISLVKTS